jgi:hypothetical protein
MIDLAIASRVAKDNMERQFAGPARRQAGVPAAPTVAARRAPVRRATVQLLRVVADRLEPAPRRAEARA